MHYQYKSIEMPEQGCSVAGREFESSFGAGSRKVEPLGIFGVLAGQREMVQMREALRTRCERISPDERQQIANYLRRGATVIALMEHTRDVLGDAFEVPGGSAIHTDGTYYWRRDAAEYVSHYGVGLLDDFLRLGRGLSWSPPPLNREEILAVDDYLIDNIRRFFLPDIH